MARKRKGRPVSGWVVLDKPAGLTSTQAVGRVRRVLDAQKAGHAGTLDPLATGILPIALGEATKTVPYVMDGEKRYRFSAVFGEERDTDDLEGRVTTTSDHRPTDAEILGILPDFTGRISQVPPMYSAIKIRGERSYKLARAGEGVTPSPREVDISSFELVDWSYGNRCVFDVTCGKGTYIRSLVRDLGRALGSAAHVADLRRTRCGPFDENHAISLDKAGETVLCAHPQDYLLPVTTALDDIPALAMTETQAGDLRHGRTVRVRSSGTFFVDANQLDAVRDEDVLWAMEGETPVALARLEGEDIRPVRVFKFESAHFERAETE